MERRVRDEVVAAREKDARRKSENGTDTLASTHAAWLGNVVSDIMARRRNLLSRRRDRNGKSRFATFPPRAPDEGIT